MSYFSYDQNLQQQTHTPLLETTFSNLSFRDARGTPASSSVQQMDQRNSASASMNMNMAPGQQTPIARRYNSSSFVNSNANNGFNMPMQLNNFNNYSNDPCKNNGIVSNNSVNNTSTNTANNTNNSNTAENNNNNNNNNAHTSGFDTATSTAGRSIMDSSRVVNGSFNTTVDSSFSSGYSDLNNNPNMGKNAIDYINTKNGNMIDPSSKNILNESLEENRSSGEIMTNHNLKLQIGIKDTQIHIIEGEIEKLKNKLIHEQHNNPNKAHIQHHQQQQHPDSDDVSLKVPQNIVAIFRKFSEVLQRKERELGDSKHKLESILTSLALNLSNSVTAHGRYDAEALAHRMIVRIETLKRENKEFAKMLAYGRSKEVLIELQLMKRENEELKKTLKELQELKNENKNRVTEDSNLEHKKVNVETQQDLDQIELDKTESKVAVAK
ncbi:hypothetical protein TBLA_0I01910 [Henningerozyma blattae CBS 6284]|uniref:Mum2p n=1 Tax=Henningerozyma blattae (strain ATCC 34711 / CBS 6284 / DSM 70876 / NBRC 10599 / NRRL Y-10934 / UCD 77-7) TaxID=1071380 RepID=I2H8Z8_HENB6|nr:hypothetical protein TBLA_0I01910 [Tetrapisispora blattae CBS 6284]CCH62850.1 hypothetical protein TBLA_0I01910 [Tetrapisispora blattae CBS 6284]